MKKKNKEKERRNSRKKSEKEKWERKWRGRREEKEKGVKINDFISSKKTKKGRETYTQDV